MKYTILINQYAVVKNNLNLDLIDLVIFDFIKDFAHSKNCIKMKFEDGEYFWISHNLIIQELPLLGIKTKQGLIKRIDNLVDAGILEKYANCKFIGKTLYRFGEKYELLSFIDTPTLVDTSKPEFRGGINESLETPINESLEYNNNNNNNNNNMAVEKNQPQRHGEHAQLSFFHDELNDSDQKEKSCAKKEKNTIREDDGRCVLFENSKWFDFDDFKKCFTDNCYSGIDIYRYYNAVKDWSASKGVKRRDWIATARNFMREDRDKGKLKMIPKQQDNFVLRVLNDGLDD